MISEFNNAEQNRSEQTSQSLSPHSNFILIQAIKSDFAVVVVVDMCITWTTVFGRNLECSIYISNDALKTCEVV